MPLCGLQHDDNTEVLPAGNSVFFVGAVEEARNLEALDLICIS